MALDTYCTGFEPRFLGVVGNVGNRLYSSVTGTPTINTTVPANGAACLEISAAGAAEAVVLDTNLIGASKNRVRVVFRIRLEDLPAADTILASFTAAANVEFRWHQSTGKFSVEYEGGTETDGPTVSADTWYHIEIYADMATGGAKTIDWWVDGAAQTQHTSAGGADTAATWEWGCSFVSQTFTAQYDDTVIWTDTAAIAGPKGPHKVVLLSVDTGGTVSTIGVTSEFQTFAGATPTLTAWNATTARGNIDEIPVNTTSAQDGVTQITANTANAVNVPMTSYTLVGAEAVAALRICVPGWQATTASGTLGLRSFNGTTETILLAAQAHTILGNNTATPGWICRMATLADFDTQGEIDALVVRIGFSGDATPDMGFHAVYGELAVKEVTTVTHEAQASLAVTATLTAALRLDAVLAASLAITATATAAGTGTRPAQASLAATATLTAAGDVTAGGVSIAAALAATATLTAGATHEAVIAATLPITATGTAAMGHEAVISATLPATATLTAGATRTATIAATMAITAGRTAGIALTAVIAATLPITTTLTADATVGAAPVLIQASLPITATLTAATLREAPIAATLPITTTLTAARIATLVLAANRTATATLTAAGIGTFFVPASRPITATRTADMTVAVAYIPAQVGIDSGATTSGMSEGRGAAGSVDSGGAISGVIE